MKRIICISHPCHVDIQGGELVCIPLTTGNEKRCSIKQIGVLLLENRNITIQHTLLCELVNAKALLISCNAKHEPHWIGLPLSGHYLQSEHTRYQCVLTHEQKQQLWRQVIRTKINHQRLVLRRTGCTGSFYMGSIIKNNHGNNSDAQEAQAASWYFKHLFGRSFKRARYGLPPNGGLNDGYAIIRSVMARALVCQGLTPAIGIAHKNRYNAFCLVDDFGTLSSVC